MCILFCSITKETVKMPKQPLHKPQQHTALQKRYTDISSPCSCSTTLKAGRHKPYACVLTFEFHQENNELSKSTLMLNKYTNNLENGKTRKHVTTHSITFRGPLSSLSSLR